MQADTTISSIASLESITYSRLVARIKEEMTPYVRDIIFFPIKYTRKQIDIPQKQTGNLAVNSFIFPNKAKDKHSFQKYKGGFSKKYSPFKYSVKKSFD